MAHAQHAAMKNKYETTHNRDAETTEQKSETLTTLFAHRILTDCEHNVYTKE